jgi:TonB family protein
MPYSALTAVGDDFEEKQRQIDAMQEQQNLLLTQLRQQVAAAAQDPPERRQQGPGSPGRKRLQLIKLLAEIEKRINEENARPKKRYISPAKEAVYAVYYDAAPQGRRQGHGKFPENGKKLYGELVMILTVNHDGRVLSTEIVQGSGNRMLDTRAEAIARAAGLRPLRPGHARQGRSDCRGLALQVHARADAGNRHKVTPCAAFPSLASSGTQPARRDGLARRPWLRLGRFRGHRP